MNEEFFRARRNQALHHGDDEINVLAKQAILLQQATIAQLGFRPCIHFELEGCYARSGQSAEQALDFATINKVLASLALDGELVSEYWQHQWEYVSLFNGQSPLQEADNLTKAVQILPKILAQQGVAKTLIKPVVWAGDFGKLAQGSKNIFLPTGRAVHIPNAIQINVSARDRNNRNIVANDYFGEYLQQCFLQTSLACCLLFLPETEAFERLALKGRYGLADELCSPIDISGGHQGSIALYKSVGKHNQPMGIKPLLYRADNQVLSYQQNWQETARVEHRLGASSLHYNFYVNVVFALANLLDALMVYVAGECQQKMLDNRDSCNNCAEQALPVALYGDESAPGAVELFAHDHWFAASINRLSAQHMATDFLSDPERAATRKSNNNAKLGDQLQACILARYRPDFTIITSKH